MLSVCISIEIWQEHVIIMVGTPSSMLRPYDWLSNKPTGSPTLAALIFWSMKKFAITFRHLELAADERVPSTFLRLSLITKGRFAEGWIPWRHNYRDFMVSRMEKSITSVQLFCERWYNFLFLPIVFLPTQTSAIWYLINIINTNLLENLHSQEYLLAWHLSGSC